jgi:hypothetical protein
MDPDDLRRIVREEIAASRSGPPPSADSERTAPARPAGSEPLTMEAQACLHDVTDLVDRAIANRRWTRDDRQKWLSLMRQADVPAAAFDLQRKLLAAMNRGDVSLDGDGPPFSPFFPQR